MRRLESSSTMVDFGKIAFRFPAALIISTNFFWHSSTSDQLVVKFSA